MDARRGGAGVERLGFCDRRRRGTGENCRVTTRIERGYAAAMQRRTFIAASLGAVGGAAAAGAVVAANQPLVRARSSYSQEGEDIILSDFLQKIRKVDKGTYLDIGAADPVDANNTYLLYLGGHSGVLVEPNPVYAKRLRQVRPRDIVLNAGIGGERATTAPYYLIRDKPQLNTFSAERAAALEKAFGAQIVERVIQVPLLPLNDVLAQHLRKAPDVVSIDVEGLELVILGGLDFGRYRPGAFCVETLRGKAGTNPEVGAFLAARGYVARAGTFVNTIFVDEGLLLEQ
jgi:FkbM family methyltransferase